MASDVIVGNVYDKYGTKNPIARALMAGFLSAVSDLYGRARPRTVLEVGCGEGKLATRLIQLPQIPAPEKFIACDLELGKLASDVDPRIQFQEADVYKLPFESNAFDLVICCEVLEHLERPAAGLREVSRVSKEWVLMSTPREPLWRMLNMVRGKYWADLGNTPGHVQHFGQRELVALAAAELEVSEKRAPLPWTVILGRKKPLSA